MLATAVSDNKYLEFAGLESETAPILIKQLTCAWRYPCCQWTVTILHYNDVIMTTMASQITSLTVVYATVYSDADQRKHQSSASLAFVWGIHRDRWISRTKGKLRGKCFHLMTSSWYITLILILGLYSLSERTSYRKIPWSLKAARFGVRLFQSLWNLIGTSARVLPTKLSNFRSIRSLWNPISRLQDFARFCDKTSVLLVNRGPGMRDITWSLNISLPKTLFSCLPYDWHGRCLIS